MKKKTFQVELNKKLKELLTNGKHLELFTHNHGRVLQKVDFHHEVVTDGFNAGTYKIMLSAKKHAASEVACVLPNHPDADKQVMFVNDYWSMEKFNLDLNARLRESLEMSDLIGTAKLVVCYGNHAYLCQGIVGTAYIVWADCISYTNRTDVAAVLTKNTPLIVNKDGVQRYKGIFILKPVLQHDMDDELSRIPIAKHTPEIIFPLASNIFCAESRIMKSQKPKIRTMSAREAYIRVTTQTDECISDISREMNPYEASLDYEDSTDNTMGWTVGYGPDGGTPREDVFLQELPTDPRRLTSTPPVNVSDDDDDDEKPDAFAEEEESIFITRKKTSLPPLNLDKKEKEEEIII